MQSKHSVTELNPQTVSILKEYLSGQEQNIFRNVDAKEHSLKSQIEMRSIYSKLKE
jgi:hypothetical protein